MEGYPSTSEPAFLGRRVLMASLVFAGVACLLGTLPATAGKPALSRTRAPERVRRTLTFAERVAYQYAIEEVYWRHRIWPKENPGPKPSLDVVVSMREIEKKVIDSLRKSQLVADQRGRPITASELQAEMDRMASHTKQPDVLREIFA